MLCLVMLGLSCSFLGWFRYSRDSGMTLIPATRVASKQFANVQFKKTEQIAAFGVTPPIYSVAECGLRRKSPPKFFHPASCLVHGVNGCSAQKKPRVLV